ncbi:ROK family protein [Mucilaginibacter sp. AW1-3]
MNDATTYDHRYVLCADIGGSHITTAICDLNNYAILKHTFVRNELNSKGSAPQILKVWADTIQRSLSHFHLSVSGMAFAMPGPFDYENGISYIKGLAKYESLFGYDIKEHLAYEFDIPAVNIRFMNDARSTIAGEVYAGAGRGLNELIGITLGTGFGSAIFKENDVSDLNWGSVSYKETIADDHLSTRWFLKSYFERTGLSVIGVRELALLAQENGSAREVFREFAQNLAGFLSDRVANSGAQCLLICGNIAKASRLFIPQLKRKLDIEIRLAQLGEEASLIGAASLFRPELEPGLIRVIQ